MGNRGVWWAAQTLSPYASNGLSNERLAAYGLSLNNPADLLLLKSPLNSALAAQRGFSTPPYPGFPTGLTVAQALRPLPEYSGVVQTLDSTGRHLVRFPAGESDQAFFSWSGRLVTYTWSKSLVLGAEDNNNYASPTTPVVNDVFNRGVNKTLSGFDQPQTLIVAGNYTTPRVSVGHGFVNKLASWTARDWTIGAVLRYSSGLPFKVPQATSGLATYNFQNTNVNRVPGVPLFTTTWVDLKGVTHTNEELDINCHCFDPNKTFVLNPNAWANPAPGQFGTANAHYDDYRQQRRPSESMSLARSFRIKERVSLMLRAEFTNIFNRTGLNVPTSANAFATQTTNNGLTTGGFGYISPAAVGGNGTNPAAATAGTFATPTPRQGTLVIRVQF